MKPRILHIIPSLDRSGTQKQLSLLTAGLPRRQFDVHLCVLDKSHCPSDSYLAGADVPAVDIGRTWSVDPLAYARLKRHVGKLAPDIVHTWGFMANLYGRAAGRAAGVSSIIARQAQAEPSLLAYQALADWQLKQKTDRFVANSRGISEACVRRGTPVSKIEVIPNAVEPIRTGRLSKQELCTEVGIPCDSRLIIAVGRLSAEKRLKDLIWAADLLKCVRDDTHLLIVGEGPHRWRLERYRRQCEITDRVHFLGRRNDVPDLLPLCDCLWLGSDNQGQSNAIMEAMSAGLPVVAAESCGNREVVLHRESGFLVPAGDRAAFAKWTKVLLDDRQLSAEMARRGRKWMLEEFPVQRLVDRHVQLYQELLS